MAKLHKNGLARDIAKFKIESKRVWVGIKAHRQRFIEKPDGHSYTNLPVESARLSPWLIGHIDSVVWPGFIIQTIVIAYLLLS